MIGFAPGRIKSGLLSRVRAEDIEFFTSLDDLRFASTPTSRLAYYSGVIVTPSFSSYSFSLHPASLRRPPESHLLLVLLVTFGSFFIFLLVHVPSSTFLFTLLQFCPSKSPTDFILVLYGRFLLLPPLFFHSLSYLELPHHRSFSFSFSQLPNPVACCLSSLSLSFLVQLHSRFYTFNPLPL